MTSAQRGGRLGSWRGDLGERAWGCSGRGGWALHTPRLASGLCPHMPPCGDKASVLPAFRADRGEAVAL